MTRQSAGECLQAELMQPSAIQTLPSIKTSNAVKPNPSATAERRKQTPTSLSKHKFNPTHSID